MEGGGELTVSNMMQEVANLADKFKDEDAEPYQSPYQHLEKSTVLQSARIFHDPVIVRNDPRRCCTVIGQLLHLQNGMGGTSTNLLTSTEATEVFFGVTKLFMSEDASLRRMVYLFIKEVAETCNPDDIIIVTSSLTKDMTCDIDLYRANALRVLSRIIDSGMLGAIERYVKSAIVDSSPQVASAALLSSLHLLRSSPNNLSIIKRWISEVLTASNSKNPMVQFHAYILMYQLRQHDKLAIRKLVSTASTSNRNITPLTKILLIRYTLTLMTLMSQNDSSISSSDDDEWRTYLHTLEAFLRDKSEMVVFEAARGIINLPNIPVEDLSSSINALQLFLSSSKSSVRYASIKVLAGLSDVHPRLVSKCNDDLEALMNDLNRNISTYAISTLLKTGSENSLERYLKMISSLLSEIGDEFKVQIVNSVKNLCALYPHKHLLLLNFLSNFLRDEGNYTFKSTIARAIQSVMSLINTPECTQQGLLHLCEFIEDCEFTNLSTECLAIIGKLGPECCKNPGIFVRFIFNRVILEGREVRAAAVSCLIKFGSRCVDLRPSILSLLQTSLNDEDDEVRDRANIGVQVLKKAMLETPTQEDEPEEDLDEPAVVEEEMKMPDDSATYVYLKSMPMSFDRLQLSLQKLMMSPPDENDSPLTFDTLPIVEISSKKASIGVLDSNPMSAAIGGPLDSLATGVGADTAMTTASGADPAAIIYSTPELSGFGRIFRSSSSTMLTERETEYVVSYTKHICEDGKHIILEFKCENTLDDQVLLNCRVELEGNSQVYLPIAQLPSQVIKYGDTGHTFTVLELQQEEGSLSLEKELFSAELKFGVINVDPDDPDSFEELGDIDTLMEEAFDEEYPLEDLSISAGDFMAKVSVMDFRKGWEQLSNENEVMEKFALKHCKTVPNAIQNIISSLNMMPCDGTDVPGGSAEARKPYMLHLSGVFVNKSSVMARCQMAVLNETSGVVMKIAVRSDSKEVSRLVVDCIQ